jgi:hypothetical protein
MPTLNPSQTYENLGFAVRGYVPNHALEYNADPATGQSFEAGTLVSLNASGNIIAGCAASAMPMIAINGTSDFDAAGDTGNIDGAGIGALVATGGYEVYTTAYDTGETYAPNQLLTAGTGANVGKVVPSPATYNDSVIVGCVSQGTPTSTQYDQSLLFFWTMFIPAVSVS